MNSKIFAIIPAAGVGSRALSANSQIPKQYKTIKQKTMLEHTVNALLAHDQVAQVHIGVSPQDDFIHGIFDYHPCKGRIHIHASGGPSRALTVLQTLQAAQVGAHDWALVHDAARPGLPFTCLDNLIKICLASNEGGILALPVADTIKKQSTATGLANTTDGQKLITIDHTVSRVGLWQAQTPQLFRAEQLQAALQKALDGHFEITDEASAMEYCDYQPVLIKGSLRNLKVTWPEDFDMMEHWL